MNQQQVATKNKVDTVRAALELMKPQLAMALPQHLTPERLMRVTMTAIQTTPRLLDCNRTSLFAAILTCAQLGLEPDGILGQAYLVPFGNKVQFIPGYKGYLTLARNSGEISTIQAHEVCANDFFEYAYGIQEKLEHRPFDGERGQVKYFYAYALYKDGGHIFEVMSRAEVDVIRNKSEGYRAFKAGKIKSNPWDSNYTQMGRKTAIRRLANYLPLNVQRAAVLDAAAEAGKFASTDDYGDIVIDREVQETSDTEQSGASGATKRLDQLAGSGPGAREPAPPPPCNETSAANADDHYQPTMTELIKAIKATSDVNVVAEQVDLARGIRREDWRTKVNEAGRLRLAELLPSAEDQGPATGGPGKGGLFGDE